MYLARAVNVLFSSCLLGLALFAQRRTRFNATVFSLAVAPAVLSLMSSANPSGMEAASALTVWEVSPHWEAAMVASEPRHLGSSSAEPSCSTLDPPAGCGSPQL